MAISETKTKAYYRFEQRCGYYDSDLSLCDLLVRSFVAVPNSKDTLAVALGSDKAIHPDFGQANTRKGREGRSYYLKRTLAVSFVKDLYEDLSNVLVRRWHGLHEPGWTRADLPATPSLSSHAIS